MSKRIYQKKNSDPDKYQFFNGKRYTRQKDGHYIGSHGKSIHREIWKYFNGSIPKGYVIHHIDFDPANNAISNLQMMTQSEHVKLHMKIKEYICIVCGKEFESGNLRKNNRFCSGKCKNKWHHEHNLVTQICAECGKEFKTRKDAKNKYCSKECMVKAISRANRKKNR